MRSRAIFAAMVGVSILALLCTRAAWAESAAGNQYAASPAIPDLELQLEEQNSQLTQKIGEISTVGASLEEAQSQATAAQARVQDLEQQSAQLQSEVTLRRQNVTDSQASYENRVRAAYKGDDLEGISSLLNSLLGGGSLRADVHVAKVLFDGREALDEYQDSQQYLKNSKRQLNANKGAYRDAVKEEKVRGERLVQRERQLRDSIYQLRSSKAQTKTRLQELRAAERERIRAQQAATGSGGDVTLEREIRIARQDIVAHPVKDISRKRYKKLYRASAKKYGFARDWYILAAVGKVESNHGENMGPSSAGALGPMQFLPSTWKNSGVDGNGDGKANIMDPRDAIPAAAKYLKAGGAPEDWYAALYSYNHADWYVREVLGVAEAYRRLADDDRVGPYTRIEERDSENR